MSVTATCYEELRHCFPQQPDRLWYTFRRADRVVSVFSSDKGRPDYLLGMFRMPGDCLTLEQFVAAFFSYRQMRKYRVC